MESHGKKSRGLKLKALRSDNGGEYISREFEEFMKKQGIQHETTVPRHLNRMQWLRG